MYYIGVDLGGTSVKVGLVTEDYQIIERAVAATGSERSAEEILDGIAMLCKEVMNRRGLTEKDVQAIGIGCPGIASPVEGIIKKSSNLNFENVNVRAGIQRHLDVDVYVENDANAAALGEVICGVAKDKKDVVVVTLGTGVGGGIILDGKIHSGAFCGAGEIGHHILQMEGLPCGCGRRGCYEQYASATALIRQAKEAVAKEPTSKILAHAADQKIENINAKNIFDAAQEGDEVAQQVLDTYYKYIAHGVANLINILQPEMVVIGGGMSAQKEKLTQPITKYVQAQMYGGLNMDTTIQAAELGNDAGIIGAAFIGTRL